MPAVLRETLFATLPPEWPESLLPAIQAQLAVRPDKVIVLDDDPTGTQTVHDVPVLTEWSVSALEATLRDSGIVAYILTNSRSLPRSAAMERNQTIVHNLKAAAEVAGRGFVLVSRSDSTLRGHYPAEVEALAEALAQPIDGVLLLPFFLEGGRFTINDTHYVAEGAQLIPASETEYARDASFGYQHAYLPAWVEEKHGGRIEAREVVGLSLETIRQGGPEAVTAQLLQLQGDRVCVVNAASYRDLEVFVAGLLAAEAQGRRFIYRTAASFVRVRGGLQPRPLLTAAELAQPGQPGLVIAGSYIQKSSRQIAALQQRQNVCSLEVDVSQLLSQATRTAEIARVQAAADAALTKRQVALVYTSRHLVTASEAEQALQIGHLVSSGLVEIVQGIHTRPGWVIAKGGITASDIATHALGIRQAQVMGQAIPGVPIWRTGAESRWPGLTYVVFPGNVGGDMAIAEMVAVLDGEAA